MRRICSLLLLLSACAALAQQSTPNLGLVLVPQSYPNAQTIINNNFTKVDTAYSGLAPYQGAWSSSVTYSYGSMVLYSSAVYLSLQASNLNHIPSSSPTYWQGLGGSGSMVYPGIGVANSTGSAWGTSYAVGVLADDLVQLNSSAQLPAVSGLLLTALPTDTSKYPVLPYLPLAGGTLTGDLYGTYAIFSNAVNAEAATTNDTAFSVLQSTPAISSANYGAPYSTFCGNFWNGAASTADCWYLHNVLGGGTNPTSTFVLSKVAGGTPGTSEFEIGYKTSILGVLDTAASTTAGAGFNLPHGAAPTSPNNGDMWTTTAGVFARINGVTVGPFGTGGGGMVYPGSGVPNSTGTAWGISYTVGAAANNLVQLNSSSQLPAVDGSLLTTLNFSQLGGNPTDVQLGAGPTDTYVLTDAGGTPTWEAPSGGGGAWITDPPYNAACDGSTDDTAAIQAAINSGKVVNFPVSTTSDLQQCNVNSPLTGPSGGQTVLVIHGNGSELNYLGSASTTAITLAGEPSYVSIDNLYLNTQTLSTGNTGIRVRRRFAGTLQRLYMCRRCGMRIRRG